MLESFTFIRAFQMVSDLKHRNITKTRKQCLSREAIKMLLSLPIYRALFMAYEINDTR